MILSKNETFFVGFLASLGLVTSLYGEMSVGLLIEIRDNAKQTLLSQNHRIGCEPFGIIPLEKMVQNGFNPQECQKEIALFHKSHPHLKSYAKEQLSLQMTYHYETIPQGCILYANGPESYSEMLLKEGLAIRDRQFNNNEWNGRLKKAEEGAVRAKKGLHDTLIQKLCIKEEK